MLVAPSPKLATATLPVPINLEASASPVAIGAPELRDGLRRELPPHQADLVQAVDARAVPDGLRKRQRVLGDHREAADERVLAHPAVLVDAGEGADRGVVLDGDVTAERGGVAEYRVAADAAVVCHVGVGHQDIVIPDRRHASAPGRAAMDRYELPEHVVVSDAQIAALPREVLVQRIGAEHGPGGDLVACAHAGPPLHVHVCVQQAPRSQHHILFHHAEFADPALGADDRVRVNARCGSHVGRRVNGHEFV